MRKLPLVCIAIFMFVPTYLPAQNSAKRTIAIDDIYRMAKVGSPQVSPDGNWVAYTVTTIDKEADRRRTALWMVNWEGTQDLQLTFGKQSSSSPKWSPDGKYLSFLSSDGEKGKTQIWLLDRRGGAPRPLTNVKENIGDYQWSPDGKRILLEMSESDDVDPGDVKKDGAAPKAPKPIVLDRYHFKHDVGGYITAGSRSRLFLFEVDGGKLETLTSDRNFDDTDAEWSPDGKQIAFVSNHEKDPDQSPYNEIYVVDAHAGAAPRKVVSAYSAGGQRLSWSPDGSLIAYLLGYEAKYNAYNMNRLAVVTVANGTSHVLTEKFDRGVSSPKFTADGSAIEFLVPDDRSEYPAKISVNGGSVERLVKGEFVAYAKSSAGGHTAVDVSTDAAAEEIYALDGGNLRKLTSHNDALIAQWQLGVVEDISFKSKDGTEVHGLMVKPPSYDPAKKYPLVLWIHGGPNGQDDHALPFSLYPLQVERQIFAAQGYLVLAINYRGSNGRGAEFTRSILGDWGNKEVADLQAGVDWAIAKGIADPDRLGIGGWSYGGILTDYMVASDPRFKAAISGAGSANQLSMYGSDQYVLQYNNELGPPWKNQDTWIKVSYPFFHADRIHTPTLFLGGQSDFNVPIIGGEQMYQALRTLGVPTELVIYPEQFHLFTRPSYIHDRLQRYVAWFGKYLNTKN
ncbi:MAG TPA: S9 family peptidase [Candidatus Saccharimonadales bacterium]|nr:S9 family peptidase [Candidatus Saccharimonadales bacterium]